MIALAQPEKEMGCGFSYTLSVVLLAALLLAIAAVQPETAQSNPSRYGKGSCAADLCGSQGSEGRA